MGLLQPQYRRHYPWSPQPCTLYLLIYQALVLKTCWLALSLSCSTPAVTLGKRCELSTSWVIQACRPACPPDEKLGTAERAWPQTFNFASSWFICQWAKSSRLMRSCKTSHPYCRLAFAITEHRASFAGKWTSIPSALFPMRWLSEISSKGQSHLQNECGDNCCGWARKTCGQYSHF